MNELSNAKMGKFTGLEQPVTLSLSRFKAPEYSASRLTGAYAEAGTPVKLETDDAYLVCIQRNQLPSFPYWIDGRPAEMEPRSSGQILLLNLNQQHSSISMGHTDSLSIYVSRKALENFQEEHGLVRSPIRSYDGAALDDRVLTHLGECLLPTFSRPERTSRLFVDHVGVALLSHLSSSYRTVELRSRTSRGALAIWQERRAKEILMANLSGRVSLEELAKACELSRSHFARAFKVSTGVTPLEWLALERLKAARQYLSKTSLPIDEIAERCGFSDQSHLTRAFWRYIGDTPGRWRKTFGQGTSR